jgi:hypothetical protein
VLQPVLQREKHDRLGSQHVGCGGQHASPVPLIARSKTRLFIGGLLKSRHHPGTTSRIARPSARVPIEGHTCGARNIGVIMIGDDVMSRQIEEFGKDDGSPRELRIAPVGKTAQE